MFKCSDIEARLMEILEGNLSQSETGELEEHLRECPECRELVVRYQPLFRFDTASESPVPETLWRKIQNELNSLEEGRPVQPTLFPTRRPLFGFILQVTGIAAAIVVGIVLGRTPSTTEVSYEEDVASYYAGALGQQSLPLGDVYEVISSSEESER